MGVIESPLRGVIESPLMGVMESPLKGVMESPLRGVMESPLRGVRGSRRWMGSRRGVNADSRMAGGLCVPPLVRGPLPGECCACATSAAVPARENEPKNIKSEIRR